MNQGTQPTGGAIRVGDFVVDPRSGELRGEAGRQMLSAQPLHVLMTLAERPGELVTRDELRARLWPADTYVDFEHGLNAIVKRLRDALGDSADAPRYIETVPRRGYRLVATVRPVAAPAPDPDPVPAPALPPEQAVHAPAADALPRRSSASVRRWRFAPLLAGGVAVAALGVLVYVYVVRPGPAEAGLEGSASSAGVQPVRLTFGPGLQTDPAWSPDGRRIAFAADRDGNFDLFTQSVDGGEPVRITSSPANETEPAWSPDGERIVFRSDDDGSALYTVRVDGGAIRRIVDRGDRPVWMPDGRDIAFAGPQLLTLFLVKADGGEPPREVLKGELSNGVWTSFSVHPDGRIGVYGIHPESRYGFYVSDADHRRLRSVTSGIQIPDALGNLPGRAHWSKAGDAVFIEGLSAGVPTIWRVPVDPTTQAWRAPVQVTTGLASADHPAISPDGRTLAFTSAQITSRAWVFPFDADRATAPGEGRPVTDEDASIMGLSVSADGGSVFYSEARPGRREIPGVRTRLDTGETTVLFADGNSGPVPAASGSGTAYMLDRSRGEANSIEYAVAWRTADGRERLLSRWGAGAVLPTDVRRDDQAVLATWMPVPYTGPAALAEWPIGSSAVTAPQRVLLETGSHQFWQGRYSPDGRWVTFVAVRLDDAEGVELGIAPSGIRGGATWTRVAADHPWPDKPRWSPDGRTLYFLSPSATGYLSLWGVRIDLARGSPTGAPFRIKAFDSPRWHIDPNLSGMEMGVGKGVLALPMRSVKGSIWLLPMAGT